MNVEYFYCNHCGYEDFYIFVAYSRQTANGQWCLCPECGQESSNFEVDTLEDFVVLVPPGIEVNLVE
jgi:hypothetical protein